MTGNSWPLPLPSPTKERGRYTIHGTRYPSVTQIIRAAGFSPDFAAVDPAVLAAAGTRGTDAHQVIASLLVGGERPATHTNPYVARWLEWARAWKPEPLMVEETLHGEDPAYVGTIDFVGYVTMPDTDERTLAICDWKSGARGSLLTYRLQLAGYAKLLRDGLHSNGRHPSLLVPATDPLRIIVEIKPRPSGDESEPELVLDRDANSRAHSDALFASLVHQWHLRQREGLLGASISPADEIVIG